MKILTVCQYGHCRSVALARVVRKANNGSDPVEVVAVGWQTCGEAALRLLCGWADHIFILQGAYMDHIPPTHREKVVVFDVGPDVWANPYHPDLYGLLLDMWTRWLQEEQAHV
jgi:hypothetical protein